MNRPAFSRSFFLPTFAAAFAALTVGLALDAGAARADGGDCQPPPSGTSSPAPAPTTSSSSSWGWPTPAPTTSSSSSWGWPAPSPTASGSAWSGDDGGPAGHWHHDHGDDGGADACSDEGLCDGLLAGDACNAQGVVGTCTAVTCGGDDVLACQVPAEEAVSTPVYDDYGDSPEDGSGGMACNAGSSKAPSLLTVLSVLGVLLPLRMRRRKRAAPAHSAPENR